MMRLLRGVRWNGRGLVLSLYYGVLLWTSLNAFLYGLLYHACNPPYTHTTLRARKSKSIHA